jgi:hypothetical protein
MQAKYQTHETFKVGADWTRGMERDALLKHTVRTHFPVSSAHQKEFDPSALTFIFFLVSSSTFSHFCFNISLPHVQFTHYSRLSHSLSTPFCSQS